MGRSCFIRYKNDKVHYASKVTLGALECHHSQNCTSHLKFVYTSLKKEAVLLLELKRLILLLQMARHNFKMLTF